jgi:hypothetical protein
MLGLPLAQQARPRPSVLPVGTEATAGDANSDTCCASSGALSLASQVKT